MSSDNFAAVSAGSVKSARRTLEILNLLAQLERPAGFPELERTLGFPRSSLHGLLRTMVAMGWLEIHGGEFAMGVRAWEAGNAYLRARSLVDRAMPVMARVRDAIDETVQLAMLDGTDNVYIARVNPSHPLQLASDVGRRLPAHATAIGKILLAGLSTDELDARFTDVSLQRFTEYTITEYGALKTELDRVRHDGFARDSQEYTIGVECVAAPIRAASGDIVAAMSISVPTVRPSSQRMDAALDLLLDATREVSVALGYRSRT